MEHVNFNVVRWKINKVREICRDAAVSLITQEEAYNQLIALGYSSDTAVLVLAAGTACV